MKMLNNIALDSAEEKFHFKLDRNSRFSYYVLCLYTFMFFCIRKFFGRVLKLS